MKRVILGLLGLSVAACSPSVPLVVIAPGAKAARELKPAAEVANAAAVTPRDGAGAIVISRKKKWFGSGCTIDVALDDQHVAGLRAGEQVTLYADPGERVIGVSVRDQGSCDPANAQVAVEVVAHATKEIQVGSDSYYDLKVEVNSFGGSLPAQP